MKCTTTSLSIQNMWYHILPNSIINFSNIKSGDYILIFKDSGIDYCDSRKNNKPYYFCKDISKGFVEGIYHVMSLSDNLIQLKDITTNKVLQCVSADILENGNCYVAYYNDLDSLLPYNWI